MVTCFTQQDKPVAGLVSVELKTMRMEAGPSVLKKKQAECKKRFSDMQELRSQSAFHAMVLLVCRVGRARGQWGQPCAEAYLWDGTEWKVLKRRPRPLFFAQLRRKRRVAAILRSLQWFPRQRGAPVAKVADFLKKLKMGTHNVGVKVAIWNRELKAGLKIQKVKWSAGDAPWCGTRLVFRRVLSHCQL